LAACVGTDCLVATPWSLCLREHRDMGSPVSLTSVVDIGFHRPTLCSLQDQRLARAEAAAFAFFSVSCSASRVHKTPLLFAAL